MKVVKVIFNDETTFINDIVSEIDDKFILERYNVTYSKDKRKAREIMERHGTKNLPLVVFENENLDEYAAVWSEQNPDWKSEIIKKLRLF